MLRRKFLGVILLYAFLFPGFALSQTASQTASVGTAVAASAPAVYTAPKEVIDKIKDEGMNRSQVMQTLSYLSDVIGQRLTASPSLRHANEWTRDTMTKWGLQNAHLEAWGPFGRGWVLKSFSAQISAPYDIPLIAYPKAWAPGTNGAINADVVYLDAKDDAALDKYKGTLKGKIVMISAPRELKADFTGMGHRDSDEDLAKLAAAPDPASVQRQRPTGGQPSPEQEARRQAQLMGAKKMWLAYSEGAAMLIDNSRAGSGGTVFVQQAAVAQEPTTGPPVAGARRASAWQKEDESKVLPQVTLATENYNRLVRMIEQGEKLKMSVNVDAQYIDSGDGMVNNTIAEIPGTDPTLKDQVVMLGGHMDSWHSGTGATDNGAGVAVAMEAARIIQALGLKPRRTIRVALWTGEEEGLLGSRAYVKQHFGEMKGAQGFGPPDPDAPKPELVKGPDYEKLSAYYNLDNGTGKIRGVYMQGNSAVRPYFEAWLTPFGDMGAKTLTMSNTGGTDHLSFDAIGLPGFQFIQDEIEYDALTHHSNQDVFDRIQADDMKQAATIIAAFVYQTAMMDEKMPQKAMK